MPHKYVDAIFHKGAFCTVSCYAEVNLWVPDGGERFEQSLSQIHARSKCGPSSSTVELTSRHDLLVVTSTKTRLHYHRSHYEVSRYDPVKDLGETAILAGNSYTLCVST
ncbi:hypothetical protein ACUV84_040860 [Puccinellia chinampoensis]